MTARRSRGLGTIAELRDGRFQARMPGHGPRLRPCATREEAQALLDAAVSVLADGDATPTGGITLASYGAEFLDGRELAGVASQRTDRSRWNVHVATAHFAAWPLASLKRSDVVDWIDVMVRKRASRGRGHGTLRARPLSRSVIQNALNLLRVALQSALDRGLIRENPAHGVRVPRGKAATHEPWTYLAPSEQQALVSCSKIPEPLRLLLAFAIGTGMRQGEIWNLELRDVDIERRRLTVRYGGKGRAPKGRRVKPIPLFGMALEALRAWLPLLAKQRNPHGLVWPTKRGERRQAGKPPRGWSDALEAAGLVAEARHDGRPVRFHDLRHTCASSLVAGWWGRRWTLEEVKGLLRHRSITTTERYAHLADSALDVAAGETDRPTIGPSIPRIDTRFAAQVSGIIEAPPARVERTTNGLGSRSKLQRSRVVTVDFGLIEGLSAHGEAGQVALVALASGGPAAVRLATAVCVEAVRLGAAATQGRGKHEAG